jgi:hypothetical protein
MCKNFLSTKCSFLLFNFSIGIGRGIYVSGCRETEAGLSAGHMVALERGWACNGDTAASHSSEASAAALCLWRPGLRESRAFPS